MSDIFQDLGYEYMDIIFNDFLKSIQYDKKIEYNDMNYEYFTIQWMSIWIKDVDFILKNINIWKNDLKKIIKCENKEVRSYLIYYMLNEIMEKNETYKKTYKNILHQKFKSIFDKVDNIDNNNSINDKKIINDLNDINTNKDIVILEKEEKKENKNKENNEIKEIINIDIEEIMNKIDIHQIYKIEDENKNKDIKNKKRKFGDYFDINIKNDNNLENNEDDLKKPFKKNIKLEINKELDFSKEKTKNIFKEDNKENKDLNNINLFFENMDNNKNQFKLFNKPQRTKTDYFLGTLGIWKEKDELKNKNKEIQKKERNDRYKNRNSFLNKKELLNKINKRINLIKKNKN